MLWGQWSDWRWWLVFLGLLVGLLRIVGGLWLGDDGTIGEGIGIAILPAILMLSSIDSHRQRRSRDRQATTAVLEYLSAQQYDGEAVHGVPEVDVFFPDGFRGKGHAIATVRTKIQNRERVPMRWQWDITLTRTRPSRQWDAVTEAKSTHLEGWGED